MFRALLLVAPLLLVPVSLPSIAPIDAAAIAQSRTGEKCDEAQNQRRRTRGRGIGGIVGGLVGGRLGPLGNAVTSVAPVGSLLGEAVAAMLDCREQRQAATATEQAVARAERSGAGTSATWTSETRANVSGSSTVTSVEATAYEGECMTVTDVIIIDGEETRAPKRMCRRPPNNRYVRV